MLGAVLVNRVGDRTFARLVPWLIFGATALFAVQPLVRRTLAAGESRGVRLPAGTQRWLVPLFQLAVATYGGFFGAGMGIVMLAALAITEGDDFHLINSAKHLCSTLIQLVAVVLFVVAGLVSWPETLIVGAASVIGGYLGVVFGRRLPASVIRWLVIAVGAALTLYFFIR